MNNAYITTLQVNANSYLNGDVFLSRGGDPYGHLIGPSKAHAIVLRGDAIGVGQNTYSIERGGYTTFVEWGGVWRCRQIRDTFNNICFEINPSFVNVPKALRVGNVDINDIYEKRPWVAGGVNGSDGAIVSTLGRYPFTVDRRGAGGYDISWSSNTMPVSYTHLTLPTKA